TPFGTPLMAAVTNEWNKDIIAILIKAGADVNLQDRSGKTALFYAAAYDCNKIISQLLAAGADTDIKDFDGLTYMDVNKQDLKK
ncbi:MAG: ankyrin repeat domain-containing protein, partial [Alphaproteobacteria bacterium]|nr:ankyrin repeat domain-containing protein [Alphaproteobacteria bacterium]